MLISERHEGKEGTISVLHLEGRLDQQGSEILQHAATKLLETGRKSLILDFGGVTFIASVGVRAMMIPARTLSSRQGRLAIVGLSPTLQRFFAMTGLHHMFSLFENVEAALAEGNWPA